jgi:hypothetical protein
MSGRQSEMIMGCNTIPSLNSNGQVIARFLLDKVLPVREVDLLPEVSKTSREAEHDPVAMIITDQKKGSLRNLRESSTV